MVAPFPQYVRFVCTREGTHKRRVVGTVIRFPDDDTIVLHTDRTAHFGLGISTDEGRGDELSDVMWHLRCNVCRMHLERKDLAFTVLIDSLLSPFPNRGTVEVDLSRLPAMLR